MKKPADFSVYKFDEGIFVKLGKNTVKSRGFKLRKCAISRKIGIIAKHHYARFCKGIAAASVTFRGKRATAAQTTDFLKIKKPEQALLAPAWCAIRDLNPYGRPPDPKSGASANSANRA